MCSAWIGCALRDAKLEDLLDAENLEDMIDLVSNPAACNFFKHCTAVLRVKEVERGGSRRKLAYVECVFAGDGIKVTVAPDVSGGDIEYYASVTFRGVEVARDEGWIDARKALAGALDDLAARVMRARVLAQSLAGELAGVESDSAVVVVAKNIKVFERLLGLGEARGPVQGART